MARFADGSDSREITVRYFNGAGYVVRRDSYPRGTVVYHVGIRQGTARRSHFANTGLISRSWRCPHRRGAIDLDTGAWHCYLCGQDVYND